MSGGRGRLLAALAALAVGIGVSLWAWTAASPSGGPGAVPHVGGEHERIVCLSPAAAEIVYALGAGPRVVGVSRHTRWPPEAARQPKCGGYFAPDYETIISLRPDLIVAQVETAGLEEFARRNGYGAVRLSLTDLDSIVGETRRLGAILGLRRQAEALCRRMGSRLAAVRRRAAAAQPVDVLLVTGREPGSLSSLYTCGAGTFLHGALELAGGRNVFADLPVDYGMVNKEALVGRAPEVIVELHGDGSGSAEAGRKAREVWAGLGTLPAVRDGRVYAIGATWAMVPGPRVVELAERLAQLLHGEDDR